MVSLSSVEESGKILVFGTGRICSRYRKTLEMMGVQAFIDNNPQKQGALMWGKMIYEPAYGVSNLLFDKIYIMSSYIYEMSNQLKKMGVKESKIDSYLSIENKLGDSVFKKKNNIISQIEIKKMLKGKIGVFPDDYSVLEIFKYICNDFMVIEDDNIPNNVDFIAYHGLNMSDQKAEVYQKALENNVPVVFFEDGFLRSVVPCGFKGKKEWSIGRSVILDGRGLYINAFSESEVERILNSNFELNNEEKCRVNKLIKKIIDNYISKYNNQPIVKVAVGRKNVVKVLVVDQVPGDKSIKYGLAQEKTFYEMLETALKENPNADILVKTHPATERSHYININRFENVYIINYPMNPIALLKYVDKVYVCTSQMGFEALMCNKDVHVFGMPFYAGWGITNDRMECSRRQEKRTVEEIFYVAYILLPIYISTRKERICDIEEVIEELLLLREEYFLERYMQDVE